MATKHQRILGHPLTVFSGAGTPVDGVVGTGTGAGKAQPGSLYVDTTASGGRLFQNKGTKASPSWKLSTQIVSLAVAAASNGAGPVTLTGAKVGDKVVLAYNMTDLTDSAAGFETVITVADQIQQSSATNLSAKKHLFQLAR